MSIVHFNVSVAPIDPAALRTQLLSARSGAFVSFEGWVRNHHAGRAVNSLSYHAHPTLAASEGARVMHSARAQFAVDGLICIHRLGILQLNDLAVWVGVSAGHRDAAFAASRFIIDEIKAHVPIWKHEQYADAQPQWLHPNSFEAE
jgi:molybdopterin synthase catalytic subunit